MTKIAAVSLVALVMGVPAARPPHGKTMLLRPAALHAKAPEAFRVRFKTTKGAFVVTVHSDWAPRGAKRFYNLVRWGFYDGNRLFRVIPGFVVQWGINPSPRISRAWRHAAIKDDPVIRSNVRGMVSFASTNRPNSRATQIFVNLSNNAALDASGFSPFGRVTAGLKVIDRLFSGYGEMPATRQAEMETLGEAFVRRTFPKLDRVVSARIVG